MARGAPRLKACPEMPIVHCMEAGMGAVCEGGDVSAAVPLEWPLAVRRDDAVEWQVVVDEMARRRARVTRALTSPAISSPEALERVLVRLHRARPSLLAHARRVARYAAATAHELCLPALACLHVERAALVHDLGKLTLPDGLRPAPGPFSARNNVRTVSFSRSLISSTLVSVMVTEPALPATWTDSTSCRSARFERRDASCPAKNLGCSPEVSTRPRT